MRRIAVNNRQERELRLLIREICMQEDSAPALIRNYSRQIISAESRKRRRITEAFMAHRPLRQLLVEHRSLLSEAEMTVGDLLASFDNTVNDMDDAMMKFIENIVNFAKEYTPDNVKEMIKKGEKSVKQIKSFKKDNDQILLWFKDFGGHAKQLVAAVKESRSAAEGIKKQLSWMWGNKKDVMKSAFEHIGALKEMYEENETFKECVDKIFGAVFKKSMIKLAEEVVKFIPYGDKLIAGYKILQKTFEIGGKIKDMFASFRKTKASPQDKLASFAEEIVQGPDNDQLGKLGKAIQLDDRLEKTIDNKLEARFIEKYIETLRNADPNTPLSKLSADDMLSQFIEKEQQGVEVAAPKA